jgi:signal transduction histidine kinase
LIWISGILLIYFAWIRSIFRPIQIVTENIKNIIDRKKYATIRYREKNEFAPLISTINNLQKTLSIQEKIRSDFLSDISHEIRTPITAVQCYLEAIEDGMMQLDEKTLPMLQNELTRLTDITSRIMNYEHLTNDLFEHVQVENFSLSEITEEVISGYTPQLEKTEQEIQKSFPVDNSINMDFGMYVQILHNIFSNFIKYAGNKSTLVIEYRKTKKEYIITFSDNGIGIPDKEIAYVKEKFYRVDKARTHGKNGSMGIGLSIVDRISRLHR